MHQLKIGLKTDGWEQMTKAGPSCLSEELVREVQCGTMREVLVSEGSEEEIHNEP